MKKLLRVDMQDGESQYSEYAICKDEDEALELAGNWTDGFMRAVRNKEIMDITEKEIKTLEKLRVI